MKGIHILFSILFFILVICILSNNIYIYLLQNQQEKMKNVEPLRASL